MSQSSLRNSDGNPFLYLEGTAGSTALGVDTTDFNSVKLVTSDSIVNVEPTSTTPSILVESTTPGDIKFFPKGAGQSTFVNGNVELLAGSGTAGNLLMQDTTAGGVSGVIEFGGNRFIHNFGSSNTFIGENAGNFTVSLGGNVGIGSTALIAATSAQFNTCVGTSAGAGITTSDINTAMGSTSLASLTTGGGSNVAIGSVSLGALTTGQLNTALGYSSGVNYTGAESSNIVISNSGTLGESNKIRIGTQGALPGQQNQAFMAGIAATSVTATGVVQVASTGQLGGSNGANGQVLVGGGTGPLWANITSTGATVTVTSGANTINLETATAPGITWSVITSDQTAAVNNGYITNKGSALLLALPTTSAVGTIVRVTGINTALGWKVTQAASQQIFFGTSSTSAGVTGFLQSANIRDSIEMVCVVANLTWNVISSVGNITVN